MGSEASFVLPVGTVTLLLADIEGSTRLWEERAEEMTGAVGQLDRVVDEAVGGHNGVRPVEQGEGDSFVAAFSRASDAVACAAEIQRGLADGPLRVRMAVHTGEVQLRDEGNYVGPAVNRAARLRDCGHGGQVLLSQTAGDLVRDSLPTEFTLEDLGTHRLRDLGRPERIFQLCPPGLAHEFPSLRSLDATPNNLPVQLTSFIGRDAELTVLRKLFSEARMVTLTGSGGCGKTRLAVELGAQVLDQHPDGVWVVDLAPVTDAELVASTGLRALGLREEQGRDPADALAGYLRGRTALLILDNCEHLISACAGLAETLLRGCPPLNLVATSREPLGVPGELPWRVPSLSVPAGRMPLRIEALGLYEAVRLFVDRARRARPNFEVTNDSGPAVAEICHRLDGIPLAIELAAARARVLTPRQICDGLTDRFRLLTGGARTAMPRQQTLQASVDWSYELLSQDERSLLHRLSVFAGGFGLDAAEQVCAGEGLEPLGVLDLLTGLVDKSLVLVDDRADAARYHLLETIRQYGDARLRDSQDSERVRDRHQAYYLGLATRIEPKLFGPDQGSAIAELLTEYANLSAAFEWSRDRGDAEAALQFVSSLFYYFIVRGLGGQGRRWAQAALAMETDLPALRASVLVADGHLAVFGGQFLAALPAAEEAVEIFETSGDETGLLRAEGLAAELAAFADPAPGVISFTANLDKVRATDDVWWLTEGLCNLGSALLTAGDVRGGRAAVQEALSLATSSGDPFEHRQAQGFLAWVALWQGELDETAELLVPLIDTTRAVRDTTTLTLALATHALVLTYQGDYEAARSASEQAMAVGDETQNIWVAAALIARAVLAFFHADVEEVQAASDDFRRITEATGLPDLIQPWLCRARVAQGEVREGRQLLASATEASGAFYGVGVAQAWAVVERAEGNHAEAEDAGHRALALARAGPFHLAEVDALEVLAALAADLESYEEAARLFGAVDARREVMTYARPPVLEAMYGRDIGALRAVLDIERFEVASAEGAAMTLDDALTYATRGRGERKRPSTGWVSLTPAELSVVHLVAEGLSNQQTAERLFITRRTVGTHLTHVFAKLGLSSRAELIAQAVRRRPLPDRRSPK